MVGRIQRQRTKGYRLPVNAVCVGRPGRWGNPFRSAGSFRQWLHSGTIAADLVEPVDSVLLSARRRWILENIKSLQGRQLACWCRVGAECHADILLQLANSDDVPALSPEAIENIRQLRGCAIPWCQVAAAVGASEAACRAALGFSMPEPPADPQRRPWDFKGGA